MSPSLAFRDSLTVYGILGVAAIGAIAYGLTGCAQPVPAPVITSDLAAEANAIIADAEALCGFEAEYASVINLIPVYGADVTAAAADICAPVAGNLVRTVTHNGKTFKVSGKMVR
jgi:hypothetical protein